MVMGIDGPRFFEFISLDQRMQSWTIGCIIQEIPLNITLPSLLFGPARAGIAGNQALHLRTLLDSHMGRPQLCHRLLLNNLLGDQLTHILLTLPLLAFILHISHVHLRRLLLIHKNISLREPYAVIMHLHLYVEVFDQTIEEGHPVDIRVEVISSPGEDQNRPEEVNEHGVDYGVMVEACLNVGIALTQQSEELHDELFELHVIEHLLILGLIEDKGEIGVIYDVLDLPDVLLEVAVIHLEAQFQVLIVKHSQVSLRIVFEDFDHAGGVHQVAAEEGRQLRCGDEDVGALCDLEILQISHTVK